jgi:diguanylate cyclase (GGDEF)-like protein
MCAAVSHRGWPWDRRARLAEDEIRRLRKELRAERYAAYHDHLTGLPNRRGFKANATGLVTAADHAPLVGMLIDLDDFKQVNDTLGHAAGDEVLVTLAGRIARCAGEGLVARLSGDEFVVLLSVGRQHDISGEELAERLAGEIAAPIRVAEHLVRVTASIGVTQVQGPTQLSDILARADAAMYREKAARERAAIITPCWEPYAAVTELPVVAPSRRDAAHERLRDARRPAVVRHPLPEPTRSSVPVHTLAGSTAGGTADTLGWEANR